MGLSGLAPEFAPVILGLTALGVAADKLTNHFVNQSRDADAMEKQVNDARLDANKGLGADRDRMEEWNRIVASNAKDLGDKSISPKKMDSLDNATNSALRLIAGSIAPDIDRVEALANKYGAIGEGGALLYDKFRDAAMSDGKMSAAMASAFALDVQELLGMKWKVGGFLKNEDPAKKKSVDAPSTNIAKVEIVIPHPDPDRFAMQLNNALSREIKAPTRARRGLRGGH